MKYGNKCIFDVSFKEKEEQKVYRFWSIFLNRQKCDVVRMIAAFAYCRDITADTPVTNVDMTNNIIMVEVR